VATTGITSVTGSKGAFDLGTKQGGEAASFDPYTEMARAFRFNLLLNPGMVRDMLRAMRTGGSGGSRLAALRQTFLPGGIQQNGVPVGLSGSSNLGNSQGTSSLASILPWVNGLYSMGKNTGAFDWLKSLGGGAGGAGGGLTGMGGGGAAAGANATADASSIASDLPTIFG
jgi:hypothetical protein